MNKRKRLAALLALLAGILPASAHDDFHLSTEQKSQLSKGGAVLLGKRPGETGEADNRFTTFVMEIEAPIDLVWEVVNDKDGATKFLEGVLESKVTSRGENWMVVDQKTSVGGPKGHYEYSLRHELFPKTRVEFKRVGGELKNVLGGWWFFEGAEAGEMYLVYSLHIDPGAFAPQFIVKRGMKKSLPKTLMWMRKEALRRKAEG